MNKTETGDKGQEQNKGGPELSGQVSVQGTAAGQQR